MKTFHLAILLSVIFYDEINAKKAIHPAITLCKRNDPNLSECFKRNFLQMLPLIKQGYPGMNIVPIEPVEVEHIRMDFTQSKSIKLVADLSKVKLYGLSATKVDQCRVTAVPSGLEMEIEMFVPKTTLKSDYKAVGNFLLFNIDSLGKYIGEFNGIRLKTYWNTTKYMKNNREHLMFDAHIRDLTIEKMHLNFSNLIGNNTEVNDNINRSINENSDVLYEEMKPVILETLKSISLNAINNVYKVFPYDVLYPVD